jgi:hypothetical protein
MQDKTSTKINDEQIANAFPLFVCLFIAYIKLDGSEALLTKRCNVRSASRDIPRQFYGPETSIRLRSR